MFSKDSLTDQLADCLNEWSKWTHINKRATCVKARWQEKLNSYGRGACKWGKIWKIPGLVEGSLVGLASSDQAEKVPEWSWPNLRQYGVMYGVWQYGGRKASPFHRHANPNTAANTHNRTADPVWPEGHIWQPLGGLLKRRWQSEMFGWKETENLCVMGSLYSKPKLGQIALGKGTLS